ncbi:MAG: extracellular solute-binding protein [Treponema sp.]|nr:extracellular solute-binding protein [Treponema sp.]
MRRFLLCLSVITLSICLALPVFAGGGAQSNTGSGSASTMVNGREMVNNTFVTGIPIVNQPLTLTIAEEPHFQDELANNMEKKPFVIPTEKATGIHINWISTTAAATPAILASGDLPDVLLGLVNDRLLVQNTNLFLQLDDKMDKWLPNVKAFYEQYVPDWKRFLTLEDGHIYSLMGNWDFSLPHSITSLTFFNRNWLAKVGMPAPKTVVEFRDVLRAFKAQDVGNPGGMANKIPYGFSPAPGNAFITVLQGSWGIWKDNFNLKDGKITPVLNTQNYRDYLEFMHSLVAEGLVNAEGFSINREQFTALLTSMNVGSFSGWSPANFISKEEDLAVWDSVEPFTVPGKENLRIVYDGSTVRKNSSRTTYIISKTSKNPEAAMRWWDYLSRDQDAAMFATHGDPGIAYVKLGENDYLQKTPTQEQSLAYGIVSLGDFLNSIGLTNRSPLVLNNPRTDLQQAPYNENAWRWRTYPLMTGYELNEDLPRSIVPAAQSDQRALIEVDLLPFAAEFRADAILNGVTDAKWNAYVNDLQNKYRYNEYLKWHQDWVDGKF